jgi:hypothetical protein
MLATNGPSLATRESHPCAQEAELCAFSLDPIPSDSSDGSAAQPAEKQVTRARNGATAAVSFMALSLARTEGTCRRGNVKGHIDTVTPSAPSRPGHGPPWASVHCLATGPGPSSDGAHGPAAEPEWTESSVLDGVHGVRRSEAESTCRPPHLAPALRGHLEAATSNVPWATPLARTFDVDPKSCADCGGRLDVRAVVTDPEVARRTVDAVPTATRAPPPLLDAAVVAESAFA